MEYGFLLFLVPEALVEIIYQVSHTHVLFIKAHDAILCKDRSQRTERASLKFKQITPYAFYPTLARS